MNCAQPAPYYRLDEVIPPRANRFLVIGERAELHRGSKCADDTTDSYASRHVGIPRVEV